MQLKLHLRTTAPELFEWFRRFAREGTQIMTRSTTERRLQALEAAASTRDAKTRLAAGEHCVVAGDSYWCVDANGHPIYDISLDEARALWTEAYRSGVLWASPLKEQ